MSPPKLEKSSKLQRKAQKKTLHWKKKKKKQGKNTHKHFNEKNSSVQVEFTRGVERKRIVRSLTLEPSFSIVHREHGVHPFFVLSGLVFTIASDRYLDSNYRDKSWAWPDADDAYEMLVQEEFGPPEADDHEVVMLCRVLLCRATQDVEQDVVQHRQVRLQALAC